MAALALALALLTTRLDAWLGVAVNEGFAELYSFDPDGARTILSVIASSMITVAGMTFSITMLTLQLATTQFGPRVLRNFMRDRGNQLVLGTFISSFVYCLVAMGAVHGDQDQGSVPHLAVAVGMLLALASVGVLIFFIHHIATAIRLETVLTELAAEARATVDRLYPTQAGADDVPGEEGPANAGPGESFDAGAMEVRAVVSGYVQQADVAALLTLAVEHDLRVRIDARPGRFVAAGDVLLRAAPASGMTEALAEEMRGALVVGANRTPEQNLEFAVRRIVELAQRALSPGVNDPTTALYCVDRLGEVLRRMAGRQVPSPVRLDGDGNVRIVTEVLTLHEIAGPACTAIVRYGLTDPDVVNAVVRILDLVAEEATPAERLPLAELRDAILRTAHEKTSPSFDRAAIGAPSGNGRRAGGPAGRHHPSSD